MGCMRNLQVDSQHVDMADFIANNGTVPGMEACSVGRAGNPVCRRGLGLGWGDLHVGFSKPPPAPCFMLGAPA